MTFEHHYQSNTVAPYTLNGIILTAFELIAPHYRKVRFIFQKTELDFEIEKNVQTTRSRLYFSNTFHNHPLNTLRKEY